MRSSVQGCLAEKKDFHLQYRLLTKNGNVKYIDVHAKVTLHPITGEAIRLTGANTDFTEKVRFRRIYLDFMSTNGFVSKVMSQRNRLLEERRAEALREKAKQAEQQRENNVRFLGNLAHELRSK